MSFSTSVSRVTKLAKLQRAGGRLAMSMARKQGDPQAKARDALKAKLKLVSQNLKNKYGRKGQSQATMRYR